MRLDKLLAHLGYGSRKEVKKLIRSKAVSVNGEVVNSDDCHVDPTRDEIIVLDQTIEYQSMQYFMVNKPKDTICSTEDSLYPSVLDLIEEPLLPHTMPVGRLDVDTEGLLLITNDGVLAHRLLSPKHHVEKTYWVKLKESFDERFISPIEQGIWLNDTEQSLPAKLKILSPTEIELTLTEGKYHQVKRMMHACSNEVTELKRIRFGVLSLPDDLALGSYRALTDQEIQLLKQ